MSSRPAGGGMRLGIDLGPVGDGLGGGDSVAVNGACLTAVELAPPAAGFDVVGETLSRTTLGGLRPGDKVNLERAMSLGAPLEGHLVQGHVDGVGTVRRIETAGEWLVQFAVSGDLACQIVPKGSVAVHGVSLTVVDAGGDSFSTALIPATLEATVLGDLAVGDRVNVEADVIGKYVRAYLARLGGQAGEVTLESLRKAGFT